MADSWSGVGITMLTQPLTRRQGADVNIRHIPGGNVSYIDRAGQTARTISVSLLFATYNAYSAFEATVNNQSTLVYVDGGFTATLISCTQNRRYPDGHIEASAEFVFG